MRRGERVEDFCYWLQIDELGEGLVELETHQMKEAGLRLGDRFPILKYHGEGIWEACLGVLRTGVGDPVLQPDGLRVVREPKRSAWLRIRTPEGEEGFVPRGTLVYEPK